MRKFGFSTGLLFIGIALGLAIGLFIGWEVWPTEFTDANPAVLQRPYQDDYIQMVADVYASDQDLTTARIRLGELGPHYETVLLNSINNGVIQQGDSISLRRVARLAHDLGLTSPVILPLLGQEGSS